MPLVRPLGMVPSYGFLRGRNVWRSLLATWNHGPRDLPNPDDPITEISDPEDWTDSSTDSDMPELESAGWTASEGSELPSHEDSSGYGDDTELPGSESFVETGPSSEVDASEVDAS